jgi:hypothetical protein
MIKELCHGTYFAVQHGSQITIFAIGSHPTTGYQVFFEPYRMPNTYALFHERPQGIVGQLVTPFAVHTSYYHPGELKAVLVIDAAGKHEVPVKPITEKELEVAHGGGGMPTPFGFPLIEGDTPHHESSTALSAVAPGIGFSNKFSFEEAFQNAIADARTHLPHTPDVLLKVEVGLIGAEIGGFAGLHQLVVHVIASV